MNQDNLPVPLGLKWAVPLGILAWGLIWLLIIAVLSLGKEAQAAPLKPRLTTEHRIYHYATITPELLCPRRPAGAWLRFAIAQQADGSGNAWLIKCAY